MDGYLAVGTCIGGVAILFVVLLLFNSIRMLYEYERGVVFQLGRYHSTRKPGLTIVLPVIRPILVTLAVFVFLSAWNDFMWPLIVLSDEAKYTLPVALASLSGEHVQDTELMMAGSVLTVLPVVILFVALQRAYIRGVMMGSVKG